MKLHSFASSIDSGCPTRHENWQHLIHAAAIFHPSLERITVEINLILEPVTFWFMLLCRHLLT